MNIAIIIRLIFSKVLLVTAYDYDYCHDECYLACDGDFCTAKTKAIYIQTEVSIPNSTNLNQLDYNI